MGTPLGLDGERSADDCLLRLLLSRGEPMKEKSNMLVLVRSLRLKAALRRRGGGGGKGKKGVRNKVTYCRIYVMKVENYHMAIPHGYAQGILT